MGTADVGPVLQKSVTVAVEAVADGVGSSGLKGRNPGKRPTTRSIFHPARARPGNRPQISEGHPVRPIKVAQSAIELQPTLRYRDGGYVVGGGLLQVRGNKVAVGVDVLRPCI